MHAAWAMLALSSLLGATEGPGVNQFMHAHRTARPIELDGRLDEREWAEAPVFSDFVQLFPNEKGTPSERTEVRVLYDDQNLYVGVMCFDSHPREIVSALGRRDNAPPSDNVWVAIDSTHDHRTAYAFNLNAAGVLSDALLYQDTSISTSWDAPWDGRTALLANGWSAEFMIPLSILHFPEAKNQVWGFGLRRDITRLHETELSIALARDANGNVSRFGHLTDLVDVHPRRFLEVTPYAVTRLTLAPPSPDYDEPRIWSPSADLGVDLKTQILSDLTLNATVNPDFGQVEADQVILNLSTFEAFFPEKRPFFNEGLDIFQPVGSDIGRPPHMLFYSRRIGLDAPIVTAAKLTGKVSDGVEVGLVDAFVAGPSQVSTPNAPTDVDRRFHYYPERPLHLGLNNELPAEGDAPTPSNYFAAVMRRQVDANSNIGATVTSGMPFPGDCPDPNLSAVRPLGCDAIGETAGAMDWNVRTKSGEYVFLGQVDGSIVHGGPAVTVLRDGTELRPNDAGWGTYARVEKRGGTPWQWNLRFDYSSPKLDLNKVGFLQQQNREHVEGNWIYARTEGPWKLLDFRARLGAYGTWSADGRGITQGYGWSIESWTTLPGYHFIGDVFGMDFAPYDIREISGTGIPFERRAHVWNVIYGGSDNTRMISIDGNIALGVHAAWGDLPAQFGHGFELSTTFRPHPALETRLTVANDHTPDGVRFLDDLGDGRLRFGALDSHFLSFTLRQQWVLTPRLTLQLYAQLFTAAGSYFPLYSARPSGLNPIGHDDLKPLDGSDGFHSSTLNINFVGRWEYRRGSTIFLVYTRSMNEAATPSGELPPSSLWPVGLGIGRNAEAFLLKWSYLWDS